MGCAPSQQVTTSPYANFTEVHMTATTADLGVELSRHKLGDYVEAVPADSPGAEIGLKEGDVITKLGKEGDTQFPVKFYQGVPKVLLILQNGTPVSEDAPLSLVVRREEQKPTTKPAAAGESPEGALAPEQVHA